MQRRKLLLATGGALATATAGCLGTGSESESTEQSDVDVDVEFSVDDSDLVASHISGDVLQSGQSVYLTIGGDQVEEKTLGSDVHTGGEIIRVVDAEDEYHQPQRVGLYLRQPDQSQELATQDVQFESPVPHTQIDFDYTASSETVVIRGGFSGDARLTVEGDVSDSDVVWNVDVEGSGTSVTLTESVDSSEDLATVSNVTSGKSISLVWETIDGSISQALGTFQAP